MLARFPGDGSDWAHHCDTLRSRSRAEVSLLPPIEEGLLFKLVLVDHLGHVGPRVRHRLGHVLLWLITDILHIVVMISVGADLESA